MKKIKTSFADELIASVREAVEIHHGRREPSRRFTFTDVDIKRLREKKLKKSQSEFARLLGISVRTLQNWEQGHRKPEGPAHALLVVASKHPRMVAEALAGGR